MMPQTNLKALSGYPVGLAHHFVPQDVLAGSQELEQRVPGLEVEQIVGDDSPELAPGLVLLARRHVQCPMQAVNALEPELDALGLGAKVPGVELRQDALEEHYHAGYLDRVEGFLAVAHHQVVGKGVEVGVEDRIGVLNGFDAREPRGDEAPVERHRLRELRRLLVAVVEARIDAGAHPRQHVLGVAEDQLRGYLHTSRDDLRNNSID
jgi:hypothetical protein